MAGYFSITDWNESSGDAALKPELVAAPAALHQVSLAVLPSLR